MSDARKQVLYLAGRIERICETVESTELSEVSPKQASDDIERLVKALGDVAAALRLLAEVPHA